MGYKTLDQNISFAEVALASSMENNRSLKIMKKLIRSLTGPISKPY